MRDNFRSSTTETFFDVVESWATASWSSIDSPVSHLLRIASPLGELLVETVLASLNRKDRQETGEKRS